MFNFKDRIVENGIPENDMNKELREALDYANEKKNEAQRIYATFEEHYINDLRVIRDAYGEDAYREVAKGLDELDEEARRLITKLDKTISELEELQEEVGNTNMEEIIERYNIIAKGFEDITIGMQEKQNAFDAEAISESYEGY